MLAIAGMASVAVACSDPADPGGDAAVDAGVDVDAGDAGVPDVGQDVLDAADADADAADTGASDADADAPDAPPDSTLLDVVEPDAADAEAEADAPPDGPTGPNVCGDGWRDPINEECDDGVDPASDADRACTSWCTVIDRLASNNPSARERYLGAGRHPVAASQQGQAAVMMELVGEAEPLALPREVTHQHGDQARPALAAAPYWPSGALLAAWDDLTSTGYGAQPEHGDVVLELIPTPVLRTLLAY